MANELQPLSLLFQNRLFRIPDYPEGMPGSSHNWWTFGMI